MTNKSSKSCIIVLILMMMLPISAFSEYPDAPIPHTNEKMILSLAADGIARTVDTISTRQMLNNGNHELILPSWIVIHTGTMVVYEVGVFSVDYFVSRELNRHGHRKLAWFVPAIDAASIMPWAVHNFYLPSKPVVTIPASIRNIK